MRLNQTKTWRPKHQYVPTKRRHYHCQQSTDMCRKRGNIIIADKETTMPTKTSMCWLRGKNANKVPICGNKAAAYSLPIKHRYVPIKRQHYHCWQRGNNVNKTQICANKEATSLLTKRQQCQESTDMYRQRGSIIVAKEAALLLPTERRYASTKRQHYRCWWRGNDANRYKPIKRQHFFI